MRPHINPIFIYQYLQQYYPIPLQINKIQIFYLQTLVKSVHTHKNFNPPQRKAYTSKLNPIQNKIIFISLLLYTTHLDRAMHQQPKKQSSIVHQQIQIIPKKLYFLSTDKFNYKNQNYFDFNIDSILQYVPFHEDFGPLKISLVFKYVKQIQELMTQLAQDNMVLWHLTSTNPKKYVNSILLICAFQIIKLNKTVQQAYKPFQKYKIIGFRDSLAQKSVYECSVLDCLKGLEKAIKLGWFDIQKFRIDEYSHYEKLQNGDINEIIKNKVYAFSLPSQFEKDRFGKKLNSVSAVISTLKKLQIQVIVKLGEAEQFEKYLLREGIKTYAIDINNYNTPDIIIIEKFCKILDEENRKIGVFCKNGLGKTGTMIGCYLIRNFKFNGPQAMGWLRLCRPGTVVGSQQPFLQKYSKTCHSSGRDNNILTRQTQNNKDQNHKSYKSLDRRPENTNKNNDKTRFSSINKTNILKQQNSNSKKTSQPSKQEPQQPKSSTIAQIKARNSQAKKVCNANLAGKLKYETANNALSANLQSQIQKQLSNSPLQAKQKQKQIPKILDGQQCLSPALKLLLQNRKTKNKNGKQAPKLTNEINLIKF